VVEVRGPPGARATKPHHPHSVRPVIATYHWSDWSVAELSAAKRRRGERVSLVVPARNEAGTVADLVARVRERLVETAALLDEIVVIDSDSTDGTGAVAGGAGATVHRAADIAPELCSRRGKGEAMWKSQLVVTGDLVVFMDADLVDWDTHFVPGLLGPLLTGPVPGVQLVKGFYERPLAVAGDAAGPYEGGRVTELVARPLLALHRPDLGAVVQPLAGEWAVRRDHLATLPMPHGYGVEVAALVDTFDRGGAAALAQVDLGRRAHRHHGLRELGRMSAQILAAVGRRTGADVGDTLSLTQFRYDDAGMGSDVHAVDVGERPPAGELDAGLRG
jgi:glucosyl-3-phosphoglycerate synthase